MPADYDGDGQADLAVYRGATGEWFVIHSSDGSLTTTSLGVPARGDVPLTLNE
jgi:hypothetical protein